jgi:SpoVK/Ycf46/Vps4 family AAA+-type ATPase
MLIQKSNSIIVLEDAEKLIMKRHGDSLDTSSVSALLNLSDGILSDILNIAVVITYNCDTKEIDPALKRKGRLKVEYKFDLLALEDAKKLALSLNYPQELIDDKIKSPMVLADIYNLEGEVKFYKEVIQEKRIGF